MSAPDRDAVEQVADCRDDALDDGAEHEAESGGKTAVDSSQVLLPVFTRADARGWPKFEVGARGCPTPLFEALTRVYRVDAHCAQYQCPSVQRRLAWETLDSPEALEEIGGAVVMVVLIFDIDHAASHRAGGTGANLSIEDWWLREIPKIEKLGTFAYRGRGGYKLPFALPRPFVICTREDAAAWTIFYLCCIAFLERVFGIVADATADWQRLFRLPHVRRIEPSQRDETEDERRAREERNECVLVDDYATIGDPNRIATWTAEFTDEDRARAASLKKKAESKQRPVSPRRNNTRGPSAGTGLLFELFRRRGWIGNQLGDRKYAVLCPRDDEHTKHGLDGSTVLFLPTASENQEIGHLHCSHTGHGHDRWTLADVFEFFGKEEIDAARTTTGIVDRDAEFRAYFLAGMERHFAEQRRGSALRARAGGPTTSGESGLSAEVAAMAAEGGVHVEYEPPISYAEDMREVLTARLPGSEVSILDAALALVHFPHQVHVLRALWPFQSDDVLRAVWHQVLSSAHRDRLAASTEEEREEWHKRIWRATSGYVDVVRSASGTWLDARTLLPRKVNASRTLREMPWCRSGTMVDAADAAGPIRGFVPIQPLGATEVVGPYVEPPPGAIFVVRKRRAHEPPAVDLGAAAPDPGLVSDAESYICERLPGLHLGYYRGQMCARFVAQRNRGKPPISAVTGQSGTAKTMTQRLAAAASGTRAGFVRLGDSKETYRAIGLCLEEGCGLVYIDEVGRVKGVYEKLEPVLAINMEVTFEPKYRNECSVPMTAALSVLGSTLPLSIVRSPELSRRAVGWRLLDEAPNWESRVGEIGLVRHDAELRRHLDILTADVWWQLRQLGPKANWRELCLKEFGAVSLAELDQLDVGGDGRADAARALYDISERRPTRSLRRPKGRAVVG